MLIMVHYLAVISPFEQCQLVGEKGKSPFMYDLKYSHLFCRVSICLESAGT